MTDEVILEALAAYWHSENVPCSRTDLSEWLPDTALAKLWATVGFPQQDWWLFRFQVPSPDDASQADVAFGSAGAWRSFYRRSDDSVVFKDEQGEEHFANSSIVAFARMLTLWDAGYRRIQRECPGDSGENWDRGDTVTGEMECTMRAIDPRAFEQDSCFWPQSSASRGESPGSRGKGLGSRDQRPGSRGKWVRLARQGTCARAIKLLLRDAGAGACEVRGCSYEGKGWVRAAESSPRPRGPRWMAEPPGMILVESMPDEGHA